jgi:hypothetical protein
MNNKIQELKKRMEKVKEDFHEIMWSWQEEQLFYLLSEYDRMQEENRMLKEVLEWYGDISNYATSYAEVLEEDKAWHIPKGVPQYEIIGVEVTIDKGERARKALDLVVEDGDKE